MNLEVNTKVVEDSNGIETISYLPKHLYTNNGAQFERLFVSVNGNYAEYFLTTPDELIPHDSSEMLRVMWEGDGYFGYYEGTQFWSQSFSVQQGGN